MHGALPGRFSARWEGVLPSLLITVAEQGYRNRYGNQSPRLRRQELSGSVWDHPVAAVPLRPIECLVGAFEQARGGVVASAQGRDAD